MYHIAAVKKDARTVFQNVQNRYLNVKFRVLNEISVFMT